MKGARHGRHVTPSKIATGDTPSRKGYEGLILLVCWSQSVRVLCIEGTVSINCKGGFHPSIGDSSLLCYKHHVR